MTTLERRPLAGRVLPGVLFALFVVAAYADPLFSRRSFAGRDLLPYNLPVEKAIHDAYARGRLPVWMADVSGGRPLLANPNSGALYPARALVALLPFPLAFRVFPVAHWIAAGLGMMLLVRSLGATAAAGWLAAVSYVFSGVGVSEVFFANYQPGMTLLPWIAWATVGKRTIPLGLLYGLAFLAGDVFTTALAAAASILWIVLETPRGAERRPAFGVLAAALGLGLLLALPQILASALWIPHTRRAVVGMKLDEALAFTLSPWRFLEVAVPYPFGATWSLEGSEIWGRLAFRNFFATLYAGALAAIAGVVVARGSRPGDRFARAFFVLSVAAASLPAFVPRAWGSRGAPLPLRYPEKFSVGIVFALSLAAGLAFDRLRAAGRAPRWTLPAGALLAILGAVAALLPGPAGRLAAAAIGCPPASAHEASAQLPPALAEAGLLWMTTVVALEALGRPKALAAGLLLLTAVPVAANRRVARTYPEEAVLSPTRFARIVSRRDPGGAFRVLDESRYLPDSFLSAERQADPAQLDFYRRRWSFYTASLWGGRTIFNTDPDVGDLSRMESLRDVSSLLASSEGGERLFGSLGLRFGIRFRDQPGLPGFRRAGGDAVQEWDEHAAARPTIRLLERWREEPDALAALRDLPSLEPGEIAIETERSARGTAAAGRVRVLAQEPGRLRLATSSREPSYLLVLRGYFPYRDVRLDGVPSEVFPAHLAFSAVAVPAGEHRIDWEERVPLGGISWLGPAAFGAAALVSARRASSPRSERAA
jgi:hypothetical protein